MKKGKESEVYRMGKEGRKEGREEGRKGGKRKRLEKEKKRKKVCFPFVYQAPAIVFLFFSVHSTPTT